MTKDNVKAIIVDMSKLEKGTLVKVGDSYGVVTHVEGEDGVPEDHLGIWYGEIEAGKHKIKTVPEEFCLKKDETIFYH